MTLGRLIGFEDFDGFGSSAQLFQGASQVVLGSWGPETIGAGIERSPPEPILGNFEFPQVVAQQA